MKTGGLGFARLGGKMDEGGLFVFVPNDSKSDRHGAEFEEVTPLSKPFIKIEIKQKRRDLIPSFSFSFSLFTG